MRIRYTALREINTAGEPRQVYDFSGADDYRFTAPSVFDPSQEYELRCKFYINELGANAQRIISITGSYSVYVSTGNYIGVTDNADGKTSNFTTLTVDDGQEYDLRFFYDGIGNYTVSLNNLSESDVTAASPLPSGLTTVYLGNTSGSSDLDGFVFDVELYESGTLTHSWACDDGSGTTFADGTGSDDMNRAGSASPEPLGWKTYTPEHYSGGLYTKTIRLKEYDRKRDVKQNTLTSMSGVYRTTSLRTDVMYNCTTEPMTGADKRDMREFLASSENGLQFEFDDGSGDFVWCVMEGGYTESRAVRRGDGGDGDYFTYRWKHREV
jgi:hypothetical protein